VGTVVSTNPSAGTFVADAYAPAGAIGEDLGSLMTLGATAPTATQVTITTNAGTFMLVNGQPGSVGSMTAGDKFVALFNGSFLGSIQTLTAGPAIAVFDHTSPAPKQLYGFVGTVTGVDTTAGTVNVTLMDALPSTLASPGTAGTFTAGHETLILGGSSAAGSLEDGMAGLGESLGNLSSGDILAGLTVAPAGETLTQIEAQPLKLLLDFPASPSTSSASRTKARALKELRALIGGRRIHSRSHKTHHHHHPGKKSHKHAKKA
jgi:hypothetical protein